METKLIIAIITTVIIGCIICYVLGYQAGANKEEEINNKNNEYDIIEGKCEDCAILKTCNYGIGKSCPIPENKIYIKKI